MLNPIRPSPTLPADVLDIIFSLLTASSNQDVTNDVEKQKSKVCLASCALVCRAWREMAKRYLFKDFKCTLRVNVPRPDRNSPGNEKLDSLRDFLSSSCLIIASIRRLELNMSITRQPLANASTRSGFFGPTDPESCPVRLSNILRLLPRLESVKLSNICPFYSPSDFPDRISLPVVHKLDTLQMNFNRRVDNAVPLYKVADILSLFGEVRHFELEDVEIMESDYFFPSPPDGEGQELEALDVRQRSRLHDHCQFESIRLHNVRNASPLLQAFADLPSIHLLQSLQLGCIFTAGSSGLTNLIRVVTPSLKHLQFRGECTPTVNALNIKVCASLESLTINLPMIVASPISSLEEAKVPYSVPANLPSFLLATPPCLRSVTFMLNPVVGWDSKALHSVGYALLFIEDALLQLLDAKGLEVVVFSRSHGRSFTAEDRIYIASLLSKIQERNVLRII